MPLTELSYTYTTQAAITRIYGSTGVQGATQDLSAAYTPEWWTELIADASDIINEHCLMYYNASDLATSRWVATRCAWIACYLLSQRRGNPALFALRHAEIMQELVAVQQGILQIPGLPTRGDFSPAMSNIAIDDWYHTQKLRVIQQISTGGTSSRQDLNYLWPWFDW